jgi:hypothetical protein
VISHNENNRFVELDAIEPVIGRGRHLGPRFLQYGLDPEALYVIGAVERERLRPPVRLSVRNRYTGELWSPSGVVTEHDLRSWR